MTRNYVKEIHYVYFDNIFSFCICIGILPLFHLSTGFWKGKMLKSAKMLNLGFSKAKILKSAKIFNSGFWKALILMSAKILV